MLDVTIIVAFLAGLVSFISPCVLPLVPPYLCYISGITYNDLVESGTGVQRRVIPASCAFVSGFSIIFVSFGATASIVGQFVSGQFDLLSKIAGALIIVFGFHFLGVIRLAWLYREFRIDVSKGGDLIGAFGLGMAFAFGWTPCVGPILAAILFTAGAQESVWSGVVLLSAYALGIGLPFILTAVFTSFFMSWFKGLRKHANRIERVAGAMLIVTGVLFITGGINDLGFWILEAFPQLGAVG